MSASEQVPILDSVSASTAIGTGTVVTGADVIVLLEGVAASPAIAPHGCETWQQDVNRPGAHLCRALDLEAKGTAFCWDRPPEHCCCECSHVVFYITTVSVQ